MGAERGGRPGPAGWPHRRRGREQPDPDRFVASFWNRPQRKVWIVNLGFEFDESHKLRRIDVLDQRGAAVSLTNAEDVVIQNLSAQRDADHPIVALENVIGILSDSPLPTANGNGKLHGHRNGKSRRAGEATRGSNGKNGSAARSNSPQTGRR